MLAERSINNPFETDNIRAKAHEILEEYAEAARDGLLNSKSQEMEQYLRMIELQKNRLRISEDSSASLIYYSGLIAGIMQLCNFLNESKKDESEFIRISHNNKLLTKCIIFIGDNNSVSGQQIIKSLNLKYRSSLSNLIERQKPLSLIATYKIHNRNVYMLTEKGRQMYYHQCYYKLTDGSREKAVGDIIDILIQAMEQQTAVNQFSLVADLCEIDNSMERYFTSFSFINKITSYCLALSEYVQKELKKTLVEKMRDVRANIQSSNKWSILENDSSVSKDRYSDYHLNDVLVVKGESQK